MRISLIENGIDSLRKGYILLKKYEELNRNNSEESSRFLALKDAILSIQHGVEILFKYLLKKHNEVLVISSIDRNVLAAYKRKNNGEINDIFECDNIHTINFKETKERLISICGYSINEKLLKNINKLEKWRNSIIHSSVILNEQEVSNTLANLMENIDAFFGKAIGTEYIEGQGKNDLDRDFRLYKSLHESNTKSLKERSIEKLLSSLKMNGIPSPKSPDILEIKDPHKAYLILKNIQDDEIIYGNDMANLHCSGKSSIQNFSPPNEIVIFSEDNNTKYYINLACMLIYIPEIKDNFSPLIFLYSDPADAIGNKPKISEFKNFKSQKGFIINGNNYLWERNDIDDFINRPLDDDSDWVSVERFLSKGLACFMNIQQLNYGKADHLIGNPKFNTPEALQFEFLRHIKRNISQ